MHDSSDVIGKLLNQRYRLVSRVGTGASANVYLADDVTLERQVAVKLLQPALAGDEAFLKRFRAEARAVAALNHPNVLQVYDWGEEESVPFLVTEYLAGGSLSDILANGHLLSPEQAALVGQQAASGLAYAHQRGLVHRDVKPANILFDDEGRLRITDFGVARALARLSSFKPLPQPERFELEIDFADRSQPEMWEWLPGCERTAPFTVRWRLRDMPEVMRQVAFASFYQSHGVPRYGEGKP